MNRRLTAISCGLLAVAGLFAVPVPSSSPSVNLVDHVDSHTRSPHWEKLRNAYFAEHPQCAFRDCATHKMQKGDPRAKFNVHHVEPFHLRPEKELDPTNLITLCVSPENHHLYIGHQGDFKDVNPLVRENCRDGVWPVKGLEAKKRHDARAK